MSPHKRTQSRQRQEVPEDARKAERGSDVREGVVIPMQGRTFTLRKNGVDTVLTFIVYAHDRGSYHGLAVRA